MNRRIRTRISAAAPLPALLFLGVTVLMAGCGGGKSGETLGGKEVAATTALVTRSEIPRVVSATGSLEPEQRVNISTRLMGWVRHIHVEEGQQVAAGDRLLSIDSTDLRARREQALAGIAEAEAVLANAEKNAERFQALYQESSVSKQQLDEVLTGRDRARAALRSAEAGLAEVNVNLGYLDIVAPVAGIIARKNIDEGSMANPGEPLLILARNENLKVVANLGERDLPQVSEGDEVTVDVTSLPEARFRATLTRIIPAVNPGSRTYDFEVTLPHRDPRLRCGMFARVELNVGTREAVLVPAEAIIQRGQLTGVWLVDGEGRARLRWIRLGESLDGRTEVVSGLTGGETVVLEAAAPLVEGDKVVSGS